MNRSLIERIPNYLTIARILGSCLLLAPILILLTGGGNFGWLHMSATIIAIAIALTDLFDGELARHFGCSTELGKILDPLADKIFSGLYVFMIGIMIHPGVVFIIWVREITVTVFRAHVSTNTKAFGAKWSGKIKTDVNMVLFCVMIAAFPVEGSWLSAKLSFLQPHLYFWGGLVLVAVYTYSAVDYAIALRKAYKLMNN